MQKVEITFTPHPTNLTLKNSVRPTIWQEIDYYCSQFPRFMRNATKNDELKHIEQFNSWIGYDMDRHQDEQTGIFLYSYLKHILGTVKGYNSLNNNINIQEITKEIGVICADLESNFTPKNTPKNNINLDLYKDRLKNINNLLGVLKAEVEKEDINPDIKRLFPIHGFLGQYRISSEDLEQENGRQKIEQRLKEITFIKSLFARAPMHNLIIADCQNSKNITDAKEILKTHNLEELRVIPLVEEALQNKTLQEIISETNNMVMFAGSDSIQRETYSGAMLIKMQIQETISKLQKNIGLFDGAGSTVNRSGTMLPSRIGTVLKDLPVYQRTIQGQMFDNFMNDLNYQTSITNDLSQSKRCNSEEIGTAKNIFEKIYKNIANQQKERQNDQNNKFTNLFDTNKLLETLQQNAYCGSRSKTPNINNGIKNLRAIDQSYLNNEMAFHPEMLYWKELSQETRQDIWNNIENPFVIDFINHYTAIHQMCNPEQAKKYIKDPTLLKEFEEGYSECKTFLKEIYGKIKTNLHKNSNNKEYDDILSKLILKDYIKVTSIQDTEFNNEFPLGHNDNREALDLKDTPLNKINNPSQDIVDQISKDDTNLKSSCNSRTGKG